MEMEQKSRSEMDQTQAEAQREPDKTVEETEAELFELLPRLPNPEKLSNTQKEQERKQLRERLKALNAVPRSDWHREFENILQIEILSWQNGTVIDREVSIGEDAPRADFILVSDTVLPEHVKSMFRIFRKKNAIEYKRPSEALTEQMIWKTAGYGALLLGTSQGNTYDKNELTLSIFAYKKNEAQFTAMLDQNMLKTTEVKGIYLVNGITSLPYQVVIAEELEGREYAAYRALSDHTDVQDLSVILDTMKVSSLEVRDRYFSILQTIEAHNPGKVSNMIREDREMDNSFLDLFKTDFFRKFGPEIQEREQIAAAAATTNITERLIKRGMDGPGIADVTGYDRSHIDSIAQRLNRTVNWNEARA